MTSRPGRPRARGTGPAPISTDCSPPCCARSDPRTLSGTWQSSRSYARRRRVSRAQFGLRLADAQVSRRRSTTSTTRCSSAWPRRARSLRLLVPDGFPDGGAARRAARDLPAARLRSAGGWSRSRRTTSRRSARSWRCSSARPAPTSDPARLLRRHNRLLGGSLLPRLEGAGAAVFYQAAGYVWDRRS